jgi:hypothetical protein
MRYAIGWSSTAESIISMVLQAFTQAVVQSLIRNSTVDLHEERAASDVIDNAFVLTQKLGIHAITYDANKNCMGGELALLLMWSRFF